MMNDASFDKIKGLVVKIMGKYKKPLLRTTTLEKDLGISGDDAVDFILEFSKQFNVDISKFEIGKYFYPEGDFILPSIIRFFSGRKHPKQLELKLGDLEKAILAGRLDDEVINS